VGVGPNSFTREKLVDIGVHSAGSQAREFFLPEISAPPPYLGQEYEQNGLGEKRGRVRLNRFSGRKMFEQYGARKAEIGGAFQKERESAGVERSRIGRGFKKQRKDRGTSGRLLGCLTVMASRNSSFIQQSHPLLLASLRFCVHYCIDRDTVQKKINRSVFLLYCPQQT